MTKRDEAVLEFIERFMLANGYAPSMREIQEGFGMASTASAHCHFKKLVKEGLVTMHDKRYSVKGMKYVKVVNESCANMPCV